MFFRFFIELDFCIFFGRDFFVNIPVKEIRKDFYVVYFNVHKGHSALKVGSVNVENSLSIVRIGNNLFRLERDL